MKSSMRMIQIQHFLVKNPRHFISQLRNIVAAPSLCDCCPFEQISKV